MADGGRWETGEALAILITSAACAVGGWIAFLVVGEMPLTSLLALAGIGFAAGALVPKGWFLWGPCTMVVPPCKAVIEMLGDPTSHNLWPFEFGIYLAFAVPGVLGAGLGALLRWAVDRRGPPPSPR